MLKLDVLLVENDRDYIEHLTTACTLHGLRARSVLSVSEARWELERRRYDVVVADLSMPDDAAVELVRWVQRSWPATAVLGMTLTTPHRRSHVAHLCEHIAKPFHPEELVQRIARLGGRHVSGTR